MLIACCIPKGTDTHAEYAFFITFPHQQLLREASSLLGLYVHCQKLLMLNPLLYEGNSVSCLSSTIQTLTVIAFFSWTSAVHSITSLFYSTGWVTGNGRFWNGCYGAGRGGRGLGRGQLIAVMPQWTLQYRVFAYDSFVKKWWIDYWNSAALSLPFHYLASWEHSESQYHLEVGHIFSNKRNDNEEGTAWSCGNCTNRGERGKSERGHREESNRSARRHAVELWMGESTVRRILHKKACNNVSFRDNK